jgi:hypothetical protein
MSLFSGWGFQSPYALFALIGLIVPVVIHLLSKSKGKLIPFGNIKLIEQSKPTRMREIRLVEVLLLIFRMLILILSTLLLAQLYQNQMNDSRGKLLISEDWLKYANTDEKTKLLDKMKDNDSYLLSRKFDVLQKADVLLSGSQLKSKFGTDLDKSKNTWLLVDHFTRSLNQSTVVSVYTTNRYNQFAENKIKIKHDIQWHIKNIVSDQSNYQAFNQAITVTIIYDEDRRVELAQLVKALTLIQQNKLSLLTYNQVESIDTLKQVDWIFYLSSQAVSPPLLSLVSNGTNLIVPQEIIVEHLDKLEEMSVKHVSASSNVLIDNLVTYNLVNDKKDSGHIFSLDRQFNLNWPSLLREVQFPQLLLSMITFDHSYLLNNQQQRLNETQISTDLLLTSESKVLLESPFEYILSNPKVIQYLVFLLVLFWLLERMLSELILKRKAKFK